jgi:kynureninase
VSDAIDLLAERLRPEYSRFLAGAGQEILFTGHSHQLWPDVSRAAQIEAWDDAARFADKKWDRIFGEILPALAGLIAKRIGSARPSDLAFAPNTHDLVVRLASCFRPNPTVITTDHEFHSLRRQLDRFEEDGAKIVRVPVEAPSFVDRITDAIAKSSPDFVAVSLVLFTTARILDLDAILRAAASVRVPVLVDAYHAFNVIELEVDRWPGEVYVVGGGYKYAEHGEGACWMLLPKGCDRRPRDTGWFADFGSLESRDKGVSYASGGGRFLGATFDPTSLYRALRVSEWMDRIGLDVAALRGQSLRQTSLMIERFDALGIGSNLPLATPRAPERRAGFVAFEHTEPHALVHSLAEAGVRSDARAPYLRLGPAPYTTRAEIEHAITVLVSTARQY